MCKTLYLITIIVLTSLQIVGNDHQRHWIFFSDRGNALDDLLPYEEYVRAVRDITDSITVISRWLNAVSVPISKEGLERVRNLQFVSHVQPVARISRPHPISTERRPDASIVSYPNLDGDHYGFSATQIGIHHIHILHEAGITGRGVRLGFLDTGYRWNQHEALADASVVAERDFVAEHYSEDLLPPFHFDHGTLVFSVVAGYRPGRFVGVAPDAEFLLAATEDVRTETPIEEDFWVAGIEWMEQMGVHIVSTSLGYSTFDPPFASYMPDDMDGKTAVTTLAAERAFERGILVVASAGNEGHRPWRIITAPADGEHVLAVGAIDVHENIAPFSSRGPSADGRIKPDICALGIGVVGAVVGTEGYRSASGTSLSAPLVSGTAALVLSARPDMTAAELRNALRMSARRNTGPNNTFGFGILDAPAALAYPTYRSVTHRGHALETFLVSPEGWIEESVTLHLREGDSHDYTTYPLTLTAPLPGTNNGLYRYYLPPRYWNKSIRFIITAEDAAGEVVRYPRRTNEEFYLSPLLGLVTTEKRFVPQRFTLHQNFPNPFKNQTIIRFELPEDHRVTLTVYDLLGREVAVLVEDFFLAGVYEVVWQPRSQASGVYFYSITYGDDTEVGRMLYIR